MYTGSRNGNVPMIITCRSEQYIHLQRCNLHCDITGIKSSLMSQNYSNINTVNSHQHFYDGQWTYSDEVFVIHIFIGL